MAVSLQEEEKLTLGDVTARARAALDVETRITKRFYDRFRAEHAAFLKFIDGVPDDEMQRWYASVMINRLMFNYFIQKKGFLNADHNYLKTKLGESQRGGRDRYYVGFLCPLFFEGFAKKPAERSAAVNKLLGQVPYLNGGLFQRHQIEELHGTKIQIGDAAFERLFEFFEQYQWHLDERPNRRDDEINPDVLGYIFEKYINQKQMGAYYTKEDITGYIAKNTIVPFLFDAARKDCAVAFKPNGSVWSLLKEDPDRFIYDVMKKGAGLDLPSEIAAGIHDVSKRTSWNKPASSGYALPTEIWREVVARRGRYEEVRAKLACGQIQSVNDLITCNLDIRQFAQDVIENCEGPELLRALFHAIERVSVLDPTCGSGAFLFAALNVLEPLYEACLDRMQVFLDDLERSGRPHRPEKFSDFRKVLEQAAGHPNRKYFILKSIVVNNLYGVDIMEEAVEICKLRLFLKLVAQVEEVGQIEPLPDIDFNIRAGNTLVGYATYEDVKRAVGSKFDFEGALERIEEKAQDIERLFGRFRKQQTELGGSVTPEDKQALRARLKELEDELNWHLAGEYGIKKADYQLWLMTHQPFHWFIDFHANMAGGGFDVIIGNPPYVEYREVRSTYSLRGFATLACGDLYAYVLERCYGLLSKTGCIGVIVPISIFGTDGFESLQRISRTKFDKAWVSCFANRPSQLFDGAQKRLTILIGHSGQPDHHEIYTTSYQRWVKEEREALFPARLSYARTDQQFRVFPASLEKLGTVLEAKAFSRLVARPERLEAAISSSGPHVVYYTRKFGYFLAFLDFVPSIVELKTGRKVPPSELKLLALDSRRTALVTISVLSSSTFFWFWNVLSDCRNLNRRDLLAFPCDPFKLPKDTCEALRSLGEKYLSSLRATSKKMTKSGLSLETFEYASCKPTIDEIDRVLAHHYGLGKDELDFIINYDIKYRMGRDAEEVDADAD